MRRAVTLTCVLIAVAAAPALADVFGFTRITNNASVDVAAQFAVDVTAAPLSHPTGDVAFKFTNTAVIPSSICDVYFDDDLGLLQGIIDPLLQSAGVSFDHPANPGDLPGGNSISPQFDTTDAFSADSDSPVSSNGVDAASEWVQIVFSLTGGSLADVTNALRLGSLRIGLHVQAIGTEGQSDSFVSFVPAPGAIVLAAIGLGLVGWRRRRPR